MAEWKKVIVNDATGVSLTGSFSGSSFTGDGSGLTGISATSVAADSVTLGTHTTGDYVASLGVGTGVTIGSNSGEGSQPTIAVDYGSSNNTAVQGDTTITINGTSDEIVISDTAAQALGGGPSYTIELADSIAGNRTFQNNVTIQGDLVVTGTTTQLQVTNLNVDDQFILLNSHSGATPADGGIIVQTSGSTNAGALGTALFYDNDTSRWALVGSASNAAWDATGLTPDQYIVSVEATSGVPSGNPSDFGTDDASRYGMMYVDTSDTAGGGLYIYLPS